MNLVLVELRKTVDTRAARWLLAVVAVLIVAAPVVQSGARTFPELAAAAQLPVSILLPVLAVLAVTGEWSQRTALTTFALVPQRWRVVLAKLAAVVLLGLAAAGFALAVAAVVVAVGPACGGLDPAVGAACGGGPDPAVGAACGGPVPAAGPCHGGLDLAGRADCGGPDLAVAGQLVLVDVATMLCGFGFGLLLLGTAAAVTAYYVVPIGWAAAGRLVPALEPAARWLDMSRTRVPLAGPDVSAGEWVRFAVSAVLWVGLPVLLGFIRTARAEVR